jgi:hypothetical protein
MGEGWWGSEGLAHCRRHCQVTGKVRRAVYQLVAPTPFFVRRYAAWEILLKSKPYYQIIKIKYMKTKNSIVTFAKQRPITIGVCTVLSVLLLGVGIAFGLGFVNPSLTHADEFDDGGGIDASSGFTDSGLGGDLSDDGFSGGIDASSGFTDSGLGGDPDPATDVGTAPDTSTYETPATTDTDIAPCNCDQSLQATDVGTAPDTSTYETPATTDTDIAPCDCGGEDTTPVEDDTPIETPVIDTPPVIVTTPPVIVTPPPVIVTPPPTPVCNAGFSGTYPNCVPISTPPVIVPPVITPPVITPPVITPPVITPPVITPPSGGGGGGGGQIIPPPVVTFSGGGFGGGSSGQILPPAPVAPIVSSVYLSQIPYTGLDLGPVGTVVYWVLLVLICAAAAYLILFQLLPWIIKGLQSFGSEVGHSLNQPAGAVAFAGAAHGTTGSAHEPSQQIHATAPQTHVVQATTTVSKANPSAYSAAQGFSSFAQNGSLTIDDIVNGLARLPEMDNHQTTQTTHTEAVITPTPVEAVQAPVYAAPQFAQPARAEQPAAGVSTDVRDFCAALLQGNRDVVFATIRQIVREGGDAEMFITQVVCAFDDAYRNRVEGTKVNGEIAQLTQNCATPFLERLMNALTNAVDSSYSPGISGSKLALTRALAVVEG